METAMKILIVEDQPIDAELAQREIRKVLGASEFHVVETRKDFLAVLTTVQPDLIISDYNLPAFDGLQVIRLTLEHLPHTPVIIFTGAIDEETAAESVKAGAVDYVIKGNVIRFRQAVQQALEKRQFWKDRIASEERLKISEERYRLISSVTSDYMFSTIVEAGNELAHDWVAGAFEEITGYTMEEYRIAGGWRGTLFPEDRALDDEDIRTLMQNKKVIREIRTVKKNGDILWVMVSAHPVWDSEKNHLVGIYGAVKDINVRKKAEEELNRVNLNLNQLVKDRTRELEILNRTKDKFFSIIAHDLKGPVAVIIASTEVMLKTLENNPDDKALLKKYTENILRSTQEGNKLLENLMEWAKTQTGAIEYHPEPVDLSAILRESLSGLKLIISNKNIIIHYPRESWPIITDRNMVAVVLRNLIANAIKYSHPGGTITIRIMARPEDTLVSIADQGVGMPEKIRAGLFKLSCKRSIPGTQDERGTGLGLILCKEFVDKMGGTIGLESTEGKGSTFFFTLPGKGRPEH